MTLSQWKALAKTTNQAVGFTPAQIRQNSGQSLKVRAQDGASFQLKADELNAIKALNSKGFQVFDLTPQKTLRSDSFCAYSENDLFQLLGPNQGGNLLQYFDASGSSGLNNPMIAPYWRTVFIPVIGTFLKVEYLPIRVGKQSGIVSSNSSASNYQLIEDFNDVQNTNESQSNQYNGNALSSDRIILIDFNNPTSAPIIAKPGDSFKTYFSGVYITFKQNSPRIRLTIGFNSEIESDDDKPMNLSMWKGQGLFQQTSAPIPFCITDHDMIEGVGGIGLTVGGGSGYTAFAPLIANPSVIVDPVTPSASYNMQSGSVVFWITNIEMSLRNPSGAQCLYTLFFETCILGTQSTGYITGLSPQKKVYAIPAYCANVTVQDSKSISFNDPVRVVLKKDEGFYLRIHAAFASALQPLFNITVSGYSMGKFQDISRYTSGSSYAATLLTPFVLGHKFGEAPYPHDFDRAGGPIRP